MPYGVHECLRSYRGAGLTGKLRVLRLDPNLELIHELEMNGNEFASDNNSTGKMDESKVVVSFLLKANKQFAETVEKGVSDL